MTSSTQLPGLYRPLSHFDFAALEIAVMNLSKHCFCLALVAFALATSPSAHAIPYYNGADVSALLTGIGSFSVAGTTYQANPEVNTFFAGEYRAIDEIVYPDGVETVAWHFGRQPSFWSDRQGALTAAAALVAGLETKTGLNDLYLLIPYSTSGFGSIAEISIDYLSDQNQFYVSDSITSPWVNYRYTYWIQFDRVGATSVPDQTSTFFLLGSSLAGLVLLRNYRQRRRLGARTRCRPALSGWRQIM